MDETANFIEVTEPLTEISINFSTETAVKKLQSSSIIMFLVHMRSPNAYDPFPSPFIKAGRHMGDQTYDGARDTLDCNLIYYIDQFYLHHLGSE